MLLHFSFDKVILLIIEGRLTPFIVKVPDVKSVPDSADCGLVVNLSAKPLVSKVPLLLYLGRPAEY